ncbi:MAG: ABC transporter permease [Limnochordales bacterium]|nr:ABC transporter permease [Limnochordales bacterium]
MQARSLAVSPGWRLVAAFNVLVLIFLVTPVIIVVLQAFNSGSFLTFPPEGFSTRWFVNFFTSRPFMDAFQVSLLLAVYTVLISTVVGTASALVLVRQRFWGRDFLNLLFMSPLMLPALLTGLALFQYYLLLGWGRTFGGLLLGHVLVTTPYIIRTVSAVLHNFDRSLEEAAQNLGAGPLRTFFEVTLPIIRPGIMAGAIFAFIVSYDQFPVSLFLVQAGFETLPVYMFGYLKFAFDPTIAAASTVSIALSLIVVFLLERLFGLHNFARL